MYTGLIRIRQHARGTSAFQTNRNLTLSEGAWAESVPNLEIETNDVRCSHASTVGPIDPEQRFYLESRGIPTQIAERLIVLGFFDEVLDQLPVGPLADRAARPGVGQARPRPQRSPGWRDGDGDVPARRARVRHARRSRVDGVAVAVVRIDDDVYAIGDVCSHANVSLSEGEVWCDEREIECPKHGSTFDLHDRRADHAAGHPARCRSTTSRWSTAGHGHRRGGTAAMTTLEIRDLRAAVGGKEILRGIDLTVSQRRGARRDGSERRRQDARCRRS